jgi:hypothetical protein
MDGAVDGTADGMIDGVTAEALGTADALRPGRAGRDGRVPGASDAVADALGATDPGTLPVADALGATDPGRLTVAEAEADALGEAGAVSVMT